MEIPANGAFSSIIPGLQIFWDSTSLGNFKKCPRYYQVVNVFGLAGRESNVHLKFGIIYHAALERYDHEKFAGASHEDALRIVVKWALEQTWDSSLQRPWITDIPEKTRVTLLRSIVWYLDEFQNDNIKTVKLANGLPALELSFNFQTDFENSKGEFYNLCGHLDRIGELEGQTFINDRKTTGATLDSNYFANFTPDNQMSLYGFAGQIVYQLPVAGIILDACQTAVGFSRFGRQFIPRTRAQLEEWYEEFQMYTHIAEYYAVHGHWPMNEKACFRCELRPICSKSPETREQWMKAGLVRKVWDPTVPREKER